MEVMPEISLFFDRGVVVSTRGEGYSSTHQAVGRFARYHGQPNEPVRAFFSNPASGGGVPLAPVELRLLADQLRVLADALDAAEVVRKRGEAMARLRSE